MTDRSTDPDPADARGKVLPSVALDLVESRIVAERTRLIRLDNRAGRFAVGRAGQHLKAGVARADGSIAWRAFTIASPPTRPDRIDLLVKRKGDGEVSRGLHALAPGDALLVAGPSGRLVVDLEGDPSPLALAVAGSGLSLALAILRAIDDLGPTSPTTLFYGARRESDLAFLDELTDLAARRPTIRVVVTLTRPGPTWRGRVGRVDLGLVASGVDPAATRFVLSGPGSMNDELADGLVGLGARPDRIQVERYGKGPRGTAPPA